MSSLSPVAWKEGTFMVPQHFQQAERSSRHHWHSRIQALAPFGWGVWHLRFQEGAIRQGRLELAECRAVFADGTVIDIPRADAPPSVRQISLGTDNKPAEVFLAMPAAQPRLPTITRDRDRRDIPFLESELKVPDETNPDRQQTIKVATKNLQLLFGTEQSAGMVVFRLGTVVAAADGSLEFSPAHPPALLQIGASTWLEQTLRQLIAEIDARAQNMAAERSKVTGTAVDFSQGDILAFWYLHTLNTALLELKQLIRHKEQHPFTLFTALLRLAGSLSTFDSSELSSLTWYEHDAPGPAFVALCRVLRKQLLYMVMLRHELLPLTKTDFWWQGNIGDMELRRTGSYLLAIIGEAPTQELVNRLSAELKLSDPDSMDTLLARSLPGIPFRLVTRVPNTVPTRPDACYFMLNQSHGLWQKVLQGGVLAVYLPSNLARLKPELIGIRGGQTGAQGANPPGGSR